MAVMDKCVVCKRNALWNDEGDCELDVRTGRPINGCKGFVPDEELL